jgi:hypothetical protein
VVERSAVNRLVVGSSPTSGAFDFNRLRELGFGGLGTCLGTFKPSCSRSASQCLLCGVRVASLGDLDRAVAEVPGHVFDAPRESPRAGEQMRGRGVAQIVKA